MEREDVVKQFEFQKVIPKNFRIWDKLHNRWFQGDPSEKSRSLQTDCLHIDGEIIFMGEMYSDQNEDGVWRDDPNVRSSLDILDYLIVVQDTGMKDERGWSIFEGDIIITDDNIMGYVAYDKDLCEYTLISPWQGTLYTSFENCIIKGNIFEDFNLLEE